jgi:hypothetical protein
MEELWRKLGELCGVSFPQNSLTYSEQITGMIARFVDDLNE